MPRSKQWAAVVAFWVFVAVLYDGQILWLSRMPGEKIDLRSAFAWQTTYYLLWIPLTLVVWRVTAGWIPESSRDWPRLAVRHVPLFAAMGLGHFVSVTAVSMLLGVAAAAEFWPSVVMQMRGRLHLELLIYTAAAGTGAAIALHGRYRDRQLAAARLEAELAAARLDALRTQLQPHFLFNSLHSIASLARAGDTAGVVRLIAGFSELLRSLLEQGERHLALADELQLVERYLEIQRVRFADRLQATIDLDPAVARARVPLLVVQPLVENALRHGLAQKVEPGALVVRARREGEWTRIDVEDTGQGLPPLWTLESSRGTGLRNLAARLSAEFGARCSLQVLPRQGGGVVATVRIPFAATDYADHADTGKLANVR
jgi:signal transduction histidine kinase